MSHMRPGTRVRFWSPRFKNQPGVEPPGFLKLVSVLGIFSVVGVLVYATGLALTGITGVSLDAETSIYIAVLHFILPLGAVYTITMNSPVSRVVITLYCFALYAATLAGKGLLGRLDVDPILRSLGATVVFAVIISWLYGSEKMKVYYAVISDSDLPDGLTRTPAEILAPGRLERSLAEIGDTLGPIFEILAVIAIIAACIFGLMVTGGSW